MKGFLKGVKHFMKNSAEKIVANVDKVLTDEIKCRKIGTFVVCVGVGLIMVSYIK